MLRVLMKQVLMSVRERDRASRISRDHRMLGVLMDKVLAVLTGPDRTLVANHPHHRYDNNDDNPSTNDNNNNDDRFLRQSHIQYTQTRVQERRLFGPAPRRFLIW